MTNTLGKSLAGDLKPPIFSLRRQFKARKEAAIFSSRRLAAHDVHKEHRNWLTGAGENVWALGNTIRTRSKMAVPRPLKRPRLGHPDVYPQDSKQKEVSFN